jgi:hypothetical protein
MEIKPQAVAMPKDTTKLEQGKYGPIFPKSPACYGFSILAKINPGSESIFYQYAQNIEKAVAAQPDCLAPLKLHYLRWVLFPIKGETYRCLRTWRAFRRIGKPTHPGSSNLSATINVRAFWNTENIHLSVRTRSRRR